MPIEIHPRNTRRGLPLTEGHPMIDCSRCHRTVNQHRSEWPDGAICAICFYEAMRTTGACPHCGDTRLLPGRDPHTHQAICGPCSGIDNLTCSTCGQEAEHYRRGRCARCCLTDDLSQILTPGRPDPEQMTKMVHILSASERPESVLTWIRSAKVRNLLTRLGRPDLPITHDALDSEPARRHVEHHGLLGPSDHYLALFERWLIDKLAPVEDPHIRQPVEQFAHWHHIARIRKMNNAGTSNSRGPAHGAKQEITETLKFLTWLSDTHDRDLTGCTQQDTDEYLASGPTTRQLIRTFFVWAHRTHLKRGIVIAHRTAKVTPTISQDDRLEWIRAMLSGHDESLPYRVAGILLLLYAQPLVRVAAIDTSAINRSPDGLAISFGADPIPVPHPFDALLHHHLDHRPNQRGANADSSWLFPGTRAGKHLHPNTIMVRLRDLGINLRATRTTALRQLVAQVSPSVVATMLGYSAQVAHLHAAASGETFARYVHDA